jgi:hypothetical protein
MQEPLWSRRYAFAGDFGFATIRVHLPIKNYSSWRRRNLFGIFEVMSAADV